MLMELPLEIQMKLLYMVPQSNLKYVNSYYYILYNDLYYHKIVSVFGEDTINVIIKVLPWLKPYIKSLDSFRYINRMIIAKRLKLIDNLNKEDEHVDVSASTSSFRALTTSPDHVESIKHEYGGGNISNSNITLDEMDECKDSHLLASQSSNNPLNVQYVKDSWKYIYSILKNKRLYAEYSDYQIDEPRNYVYNHFVEINRTYLLSYSKDVWLAPGQYNLNIGLAVKYGHGLGTTKFEIKYNVDDEEEERKAEIYDDDETITGEEATVQEEMDGVEATPNNTINGNGSGNGSGENVLSARPNGIVNGGGIDRSVNGSMNHTVDMPIDARATVDNSNNLFTSRNTTVTKLFYPPTNINDILPKNQFCFLRVAQFTIPPKENQETKQNKLRKVTIKMEEIGLYLKSGFRIYFIDISQPSMLYDEYDLLYYSIKQTEYKYFINILLKNLYKALNYVQNGGNKLIDGGKYGTGDPYDLWHEYDKSFLRDYSEQCINDSNSASINEAVMGGGGFTPSHRRSSSILSGSGSATSSSSSLSSLHTPFKYDLKKLNNYANFCFKNVTNTKRNYKFSTIYQQRQFINRFGDYNLDLKMQMNQPAQPLKDSIDATGEPQREKQELNETQQLKEQGIEYDEDGVWKVPELKCSYDKLGLKWKIPIVGEL